MLFFLKPLYLTSPSVVVPLPSAPSGGRSRAGIGIRPKDFNEAWEEYQQSLKQTVEQTRAVEETVVEEPFVEPRKPPLVDVSKLVAKSRDTKVDFNLENIPFTPVKKELLPLRDSREEVTEEIIEVAPKKRNNHALLLALMMKRRLDS